MTAPTWPPPAPAPARSSRVGWWVAGGVVLVVGVVLLAAVGFVAVFVLADEATDESSDPIVTFDDSPGLLVVPADDGPPDLVGYRQTIDEGGVVQEVVRTDFRGEERWAVPQEPSIGDLFLLATDDLALLVLDGRELLALDLEDGSEAWRQPSSVNAACDGCARVVGDVLVTADVDGDLVALDLADGTEVWSHPAAADGPAPDPVVVGDAVVTFGEPAEDGRPDLGTVVALAVDDGTEVARFTPTCTYSVVPEDAEPGDRGRPQTDGFAPSDTLVALGDTGDVAVVFGTEQRCVQRWALDGGAPTWEAVVAEGGGGPTEAVATEDRLAVAGDGVLVDVALADGTAEATPLPHPVLADLQVVADDVVVGAAFDERGEPLGLLGVPLDDPTAAWSTVGPEPGRVAVAPGPEGRSRATFDELEGINVVVDTSAGLRVLGLPPLADALGPRVTLALTALDAATGDDGDVAEPSVTVGEVDGPLGLRSAIHGLDGDLAALTVDTVPVLVDLATGEVVATWPAR